MSEYKTSKYLSIAQLYDLADDWWRLDPEQHRFVSGFISDWDTYQSWLAEHSAPFAAYKVGGKSRQETIAAYPEHYPLFVYAQWLGCKTVCCCIPCCCDTVMQTPARKKVRLSLQQISLSF